MHAKHRSPGNSYRSSSMGMGMGGATSASRISPDGTVRGNGSYNYECRSYNRGGFGRGQSKQFQPPQLPSRKGDIFMEAGRLAAEYLVSKGILPPNALPGKLQNGSLKNQVGEYQGLRMQEGDNMQLSGDGRASALSRLGNAVADVSPGRRRYSDEYNSIGSRSYMRGRRRNGSFKSYGTEWNREFARSESWSDRSWASSSLEGDNDAVRNQEDQKVDKQSDGSSLNSSPSKINSESEGVGNSDSALEKYKSVVEASPKSRSPSNGKHNISEVDEEGVKESNDMEICRAENKEANHGNGNNEVEPQVAQEDNGVKSCAEEDKQTSKSNSDLLRFCRFENVPTKTRSSLLIRGSKVEANPTPMDESVSEGRHLKESTAHVKDAPVDNSCIIVSSDQMLDSRSLPVDKQLGIAYAVEDGCCSNSRSFPVEDSVEAQERIEGLPEFGRCNSTVVERGEKRTADSNDSCEGNKKPREWIPSIDMPSDDCLYLSSSSEKQVTLRDPSTSQPENVTFSSNEKSLVDISMFPKDDDEPCVEYAEEKQLFPGSFKTCDLNLMEASDVNENHNAETVLLFPPITERGRQGIPVEIDLSMNNSCNLSEKFVKRGVNGKDIEVIDLENDCAHEEKPFDDSERKVEPEFTGLEGFPNNANNANEIPDVQDGYGLMISELLGNDIPNCSSIPADMNSLHNIGLHNGEGILGDDDSIYMTLGEIPISFLRVWEQPSQEYGKPF